ncbi:type II toxin-antitoxin system Phd/YefM family antitoxin [Phytoactinopolyspora alkaliphila]|uniref:Antitoxin n=1 Tax=Phytoactinopolyspora alkaliphila TaxID=1783498 RepID=A0A6N9YPL1_9ACTN|nr:type II toxin-antitoxin system prevent-host-death family antitoxin [Phytoactinopolyspora alkaliphila]NED96870.1 type II toxin-antitoxin system Phd/YefM family antitoxin [Phytoactinopolyspora alkaliphila]
MTAASNASVSSVRELRDSLADVIDRALRDEITVVQRRGKEVAAVVPIEYLREYQRLEEERVAAILDERMAAVREGEGVPLEDVMAETLARTE